MRELLIIITLTISSTLSAQLTTIPDASFESALIFKGLDTGTVNGVVPTNFIDTVTILSVSTAGISDLTGIEDFTAIQYLQCDNNVLSSLNVTQNTALVDLECSYNYISNLDLSQNPNLSELSCSWGWLSSLDLSNNPAIESVFCFENPLSSINVTQNTSLITLYVGNLLSSLDVTQNIALETLGCGSNNNLSGLDLSKNIALTKLICNNNQLQCVNIKNGNNTNMTQFLAQNNPNLMCIEVDNSTYSTSNWTNVDAGVTFSTNCGNPCSTFGVGIDELSSSSISIHPNPTQDRIIVSLEEGTATSVTIRNSLGQLLLSNKTPSTNQVELDLSSYPTGIYFLQLEVDGQVITKKVVKE